MLMFSNNIFFSHSIMVYFIVRSFYSLCCYDLVISIGLLLLPCVLCFLTQGHVATRRARRDGDTEGPLQLIIRAPESSRSFGTGEGSSTTARSSLAPLLRALFGARWGIIRNVKVVTARQVTLGSTGEGSPLDRAATSMRAAIVEETRVGSNFVVAVGTKALGKSTGASGAASSRHAFHGKVRSGSSGGRRFTEKNHASSNNGETSHEKCDSARNLGLLDHAVDKAFLFVVVVATSLHIMFDVGDGRDSFVVVV